MVTLELIYEIPPMLNRVLKVFVLLFFTAQVMGIIYARFSDVKFFCWTPYDQISFYHIEVYLKDHQLTDEEIMSRYGIASKGRENRSIHNVFRLVNTVEKKRKQQNEWQPSIKIYYSVNGKALNTWVYDAE